MGLSKDLSTLTTIHEDTFENLISKTMLCIANYVHEAKLNGDDIVKVDIGIGELYIKITSIDDLKYKFIPSPTLTKVLNKTIKNGISPLAEIVEKTLINRLTNIYKDLI